jgi:hypothetical protein
MHGQVAHVATGVDIARAFGIHGQLLALYILQLDIAAAAVAQAFQRGSADAYGNGRFAFLVPAEVEGPALALVARLAHGQGVAADAGFNFCQLAALAAEFYAGAGLVADDDVERAITAILLKAATLRFSVVLAVSVLLSAWTGRVASSRVAATAAVSGGRQRRLHDGLGHR